jgi:ABC-type branched-subunit amino acid transport system substrate-binding protein
MTNRLAALSASALVLGLTVAGAGVGIANATTDDGVNTSTHTITIGATVPLTGIAALGYSDVAKSANAVFKYINAKGGVNGWKVSFDIKDDCYNFTGLFGCTAPGGTVSQTNALLSDPVFATVGSLGTGTQDLVRTTLDNAGVPQLFVNSGSKDWDHPSTYPTLFGFQPSYLVEGKILANYIKTKFKGKSVGVIGQNDDFGTDGLQGLLNGGLTIPTADRFTYSPLELAGFATPSFPTSLAKLKADKVAVVVLDTVPQATKAVLNAASKIGYKPQFVISSVGADPDTVNSTLEKNAVSFTFLPASKDTTNPWNKWIAKVLDADSTDFPNFTSKSTLTGNMQYGAAWGVAFLEALQATTNGSVVPSRAGYVTKLLTTSFVTPALVPLAYSNTNHQGLNGGYVITVKDTKTTAVADKQVYTTGDGPLSSSPLVKVTGKIAPIPSWLS